MQKILKGLDVFNRNILVVFLGTSLVNFLNLLYQLLIAHAVSPAEFANFNAIISIYMMAAIPLGTLQTAVVKYSSEFNAKGRTEEVRALLSRLFRATGVLALVTFCAVYALAPALASSLRIPSVQYGRLLALLIAASWVTPVLLGGLQGLEFFNALMAVSISTTAAKLGLAFLLVAAGFGIGGALAGFAVSTLFGILAGIALLGRLLFAKTSAGHSEVDFRKILFFLFPVAVSSLCYIVMVNMDMVLVKRFFPESEAGFYSLSQMVGKIFLFFPGAISIVMLPRTSSLYAQDRDTRATLTRSLSYAGALSAAAFAAYNLFPGAALRVLTGKSFPESILLGRFFSVSMTFFALVTVLITYFLSRGESRFLIYLGALTVLEVGGIALFHRSLIEVQAVVCASAAVLFATHLKLAYAKR